MALRHVQLDKSVPGSTASVGEDVGSVGEQGDHEHRTAGEPLRRCSRTISFRCR